MDKAEALARVASYVAGMVRAGDLEEAAGLTRAEQADMSEADLNRLEWARDVVIKRLYRMGRAASDSGASNVPSARPGSTTTIN